MAHPMNKHLDDPYFYWCQGCQCYEYDCRGEAFCIKRHPDYKAPHLRNGMFDCPFCGSDNTTDHPDGASSQCSDCRRRF